MIRTISTIFITLILLGGNLHAQENFPYTAEITAKDVNVRAGQSTNYEHLCRLPIGSKVVVVGRNYSWYKIKLPSHAQSYVSTQFINRLTPAIGEVTGHRLNIRARRSPGSSVIGQLKKGAKVRIIDEKDGWYKITPVEGSYGWVTEEFIQYVTETVPPAKVVQAPSRNIYRQRALKRQKQETAQKPRIEVVQPEKVSSAKSEPFVAVGKVEAIDNINQSGGLKYKLKVEQSTYFLSGGETILNRFVGHKVRVEGRLKTDANTHPVIKLTRIKFIL